MLLPLSALCGTVVNSYFLANIAERLKVEIIEVSMTADSALFIKKIRHLSQALMISGAVNICVLSLLIYWMIRESPPTPYCELKPASYEQQHPPLADLRGGMEMLTELSKLPFPVLVNRLSHAQLIENGYAERDLALACLVGFHHFDLRRALPKDAQPKQKRLIAWKGAAHEPPITLEVYPDLTQKQFDALIQFARTERWPFTAQGLFLLLQKQKKEGEVDSNLADTFMLAPEFWTVELLFNRNGQSIPRTDILALLQEGDWMLLKQFVDQQRQVHDLSDARMRKFLLDYLNAESSLAAVLLLKTEWEFSVKKLDDVQVAAILRVLPITFKEGKRFAMEMLTSPRSTTVWQQASHWLYKEAGETLPKEWNYQVILARFAPEKLDNDQGQSSSAAPQVVSSPLIPARASVAVATPMKSAGSEQNKVKPPASVASKQPLTSLKQQKLLPGKQQPSSQLYKVQEGDTLWKISRKFKVDVKVLKERNQLKSDAIKPGTVLQVPSE